MNANATATDDVRTLLASGDARQKLEAYALLSAQCCESKAQQNSVGALLREKATASVTPTDGRSSFEQPQRWLDAVFADLQATDRTTRLAATRLLCHAAYENLLNQDSIVQLANGFSVGWVHVFTIPQSFHEQYAADCAVSKRAQTARGFRTFLERTVVQSYDAVYRHVSRYYSGGCSAFLPLAWQFPQPPPLAASAIGLESDAPTWSSTTPDPATHLVGFYLVPRQTQFPEQDDFYSDELLGALDSVDVDRIQRVRQVFLAAAAASEQDSGSIDGNSSALKSVLLRTLQDDADTRWVVDDDRGSNLVAPLSQYFEPSDRDDALSQLVWSHVLVYCCVRINMARLCDAFGSATLATLIEIFQDLALSASSGAQDGAAASPVSTPPSRVSSTSYVWEAAVVGTILHHPQLPDALKRHVASFQRGLYERSHSSEDSSSHVREPWRYLLPLRIEQLQPVSWALFLSQWRVAADSIRALDSSQRRTTTVCSVPSIRRSMVAMDARSFDNLDDLRHELPHFVRSQRHMDDALAAPGRINEADDEVDSEPDVCLGGHATTWRVRRVKHRTMNESDDASASDNNASLAHYLRLFHRMQQAPADLDKLSLEQLQEKQAAVAKLHESVAVNKKRLADEAKRKRREVEARLRDEEEKRDALERKKAAERSSLHDKHTSRHDMAMQRRQQQQAQDEARQRALMAQIELEQLEYRQLMAAKQQQAARRRVPQEEPAVLPSKPRPPTAGGGSGSSSQRLGSTPRRPLSSRGSSSGTVAASTAPPEILRQRAQIYGDVVSKIYLAEAARHPQPPPLTVASPHLARRFTSFRKQSAMAGSVDNDSLPSQQSHEQPQAPRTDPSSSSNSKLEWQLHCSSAAPGTTSVLASNRESASAKADAISTACTTLVMRNAALAVSERIHIPDVAPPAFAEPRVPAHVIELQYEALETRHKQKFRERFHLKSISHRLSYTVLKQFTKIVRRDTAWEVFHEVAALGNNGRPSERVRHADFVLVAQQLGIAIAAKKLLLVARRLDVKKNGFVDWDNFYAWWSAQYDDTLAPPARA